MEGNNEISKGSNSAIGGIIKMRDVTNTKARLPDLVGPLTCRL